MTSEKQIEANIKNAQLSSGPIDTDKTRFNAAKHCLTSKKLFQLNYREEIEKNYLEHCDFLKPQNMIEEGIVRDLAVLRTRIDLILVKQVENFEYKPLFYIKNKRNQMERDKLNELSSGNMDVYNFFSEKEKERYDRLKAEEKKQIEEPSEEDKPVNFPSEDSELFLKYETELRSQYLKLLKFFVESRKWLCFGNN